MQPKFDNPIAHKIFNLALKVQKLSMDTRKIKDIEELKILGELQQMINKNLDELHQEFNQVNNKLRAKRKLNE